MKRVKIITLVGILLMLFTLSGCSSRDNGTEYIDGAFNLQYKDVLTYDVIANIRLDTLKTQSDGSVYFETTAPNGEAMRFVGKNVTVTEGAITFEPDGSICALDAIGRICAIAPVVSDVGSESNTVKFSGGYTFDDKTRVESAEELFFVWGLAVYALDHATERLVPTSLMEFQPNFIRFCADEYNEDAFTVSGLIVYYDETTFHTGIRMMALEYGFYGIYMEGEKYKPEKEQYNSGKRIYDFYLMVVPDVSDENVLYNPDPLTDLIIPRSIIDIDDSRYTIGALKDADGNLLDKSNATLSVGCTVEVTLADYKMDVMLPVAARYAGAKNLHELTPFDNTFAKGAVKLLVIPVFWQDQTEKATDELLNRLYAKLGCISDKNGKVTDYSGALTDGYSLSEYYDISSYGKYNISSFVTDWYAAPYNYVDDMEDMNVLGGTFTEEVYDWLFEKYPDMDWGQFDINSDGFFDAVMIVNVGEDNDEEIIMGTYSHAVHVSPRYTGEGAGTPKKPVIKNFISMNERFLSDNTMIHEYAHSFGLIDYYDVTYSGIDAVGRFGMQSGSYGDWNTYSKYAVGWIEPEIVQNLSTGQSTEITIGSFAKTGDSIVIPAKGNAHDGPFGEYILIDLFTADGVNEYDAAFFELDSAVGVRMYHVSAAMENHSMMGEDGVQYSVGTVHYANAYNEQGRYHLELIQAGGDNTFTDISNLRTNLTADDLFREGDVFTVESYAEFFADGRMDDGSEFGYMVEVVNIEQNTDGEYCAVIRITSQ